MPHFGRVLPFQSRDGQRWRAGEKEVGQGQQVRRVCGNDDDDAGGGGVTRPGHYIILPSPTRQENTHCRHPFCLLHNRSISLKQGNIPVFTTNCHRDPDPAVSPAKRHNTPSICRPLRTYIPSYHDNFVYLLPPRSSRLGSTHCQLLHHGISTLCITSRSSSSIYTILKTLSCTPSTLLVQTSRRGSNANGICATTGQGSSRPL